MLFDLVFVYLAVFKLSELKIWELSAPLNCVMPEFLDEPFFEPFTQPFGLLANVPFQVYDCDLLLQKHFLTFSLLFQFTLLKFFVDVFQRNVNPINLHQVIKHTPQLKFLAR